MRIEKYDSATSTYKGWAHWWNTQRLDLKLSSNPIAPLREVFTITALSDIEGYIKRPVTNFEINRNNVNVSLQ